MVNVISTAIELGYLSVPKGILIDIETMNRYENERIVLITTGSQGEPMSALYRIAFSEHDRVKLAPNDEFYFWLFKMRGNASILSPESVLDEYNKLFNK
jgi:ribonuclease J